MDRLNLTEGMRGGDLEDLVLPLISVDEYESKIDDSAIVVGFYVNEHGAAEDLNRFIQKSPVEIIDTEISPAPDQHGYFMVFVELLKNARLARNVTEILDEVSPLTNVTHWKMQVRDHTDLIPFTEEAFTDAVEAIVGDDDQEDEKGDPVKEAILEFLTPSDLSDAAFEGEQIILESAGTQFAFTVVGFGHYEQVLVEHGLGEAPLGLDLIDVARANKLTTMLGEGWSVHRVGGHDVIQHTDSNQSLLLK